MKDKEYDALKAKIERIALAWINDCGFGWWQIDLEYSREYREDDDDNGNGTSQAETWCQWQYRSARIVFYLPAFKDTNDWKVERVVVHELSHILVAPIHDFTDDNTTQMTEAATENVTRALILAAECRDGLVLKGAQDELPKAEEPSRNWQK